MRHECKSEGCEKRATHRVFWKQTNVSMALCVDHLNVFINDAVGVNNDLDADWQEPDREVAKLEALLSLAKEYRDKGDADTAKDFVIKARTHQACIAMVGRLLDETELNRLEEEIIGLSVIQE